MKLFHFLDTAGSDTMTEPEFARALSRVGVCGISEKVMKAIMATSDLDKDGNLEYREIVAQLEKWYQSNKT
jgi:Ca2+-binding EF-hand superfamily protein